MNRAHEDGGGRTACNGDSLDRGIRTGDVQNRSGAQRARLYQGAGGLSDHPHSASVDQGRQSGLEIDLRHFDGDGCGPGRCGHEEQGFAQCSRPSVPAVGHVHDGRLRLDLLGCCPLGSVPAAQYCGGSDKHKDAGGDDGAVPNGHSAPPRGCAPGQTRHATSAAWRGARKAHRSATRGPLRGPADPTRACWEACGREAAGES